MSLYPLFRLATSYSFRPLCSLLTLLIRQSSEILQRMFLQHFVHSSISEVSPGVLVILLVFASVAEFHLSASPMCAVVPTDPGPQSSCGISGSLGRGWIGFWRCLDPQKVCPICCVHFFSGKGLNVLKGVCDTP